MADTPPSETALREAALTHLSRYATTRAGLIRVLDRRVERWARAGPPPEPEEVRAVKATVRMVAAKLAEAGAVNDAAFAASRARSLARTGRSRRAIAAHLAARGVAAETVAAIVVEDAEAELTAALAFTLRRKIGAFRRAAVDADGRRRELGALARAGFSHDIAVRALATPMATAEAAVIRLRRG